MAFVVTKSDGSTLAIVSTNSIDNKVASSIVLHGRGKLRWGNAVNENFVHMLENFADVTAPTNPIEGQLWAEKTGSPITGSPEPTVSQVNFWTGSSWEPLLTAALGSDIYVDETGDTMTGDLVLSGANLTVIGSGSPETAINVTGNANITGNTNIIGDTDITGQVTISTSGSPSGSPRTTALSVDGNILADDSVMTFTGFGVDALILNQGKGAIGVGPDIYAPSGSGSLLLAADDTIHMNINTSGVGGNFRINKGSIAIDGSETELFRLDSNGNFQSSGTIWNIGALEDPFTDKNTYLQFFSDSGGTFSARLNRASGTNGNFLIRNEGTGGIYLQRNGVNEFSVTATGVSAGSNRVTNVATPTSGTDAANKDYVDDQLEPVILNQSKSVTLTTSYQTITVGSSYADRVVQVCAGSIAGAQTIQVRKNSSQTLPGRIDGAGFGGCVVVALDSLGRFQARVSAGTYNAEPLRVTFAFG